MTTAATPDTAQRAGPESASRRRPPGPARWWRDWRTPIVLVALVLLGGTVIALLQTRAAVITGYLDPADPGPSGTHALADILAARGTRVIRTITPAAAEAAGVTGAPATAAGPAAGPAAATLVVTSPGRLTARQLAGLARMPGDLILVEPDPAALTALAPAVTIGGPAAVRPVQPACALSAARLAGSAELGGLRLRDTAAGASRCYPASGLPSLVRYKAGGRLITVIGTGRPLTNEALARFGNAALALNLLGTRSRVVWLVPGPGALAGTGPAAGSKSLLSLIPLPAYLVTMQLVIAGLLAAFWRARRLGPLVPEPLPVIVRAAETVEGHARLYQARRARDRAASALRAAMLRRTGPALGLPSDAGPEAVVQVLAIRSGRDPARIEALLYGPAPGDDGALAAFAAELDALEKEVRAQ